MNAPITGLPTQLHDVNGPKSSVSVMRPEIRTTDDQIGDHNSAKCDTHQSQSTLVGCIRIEQIPEDILSFIQLAKNKKSRLLASVPLAFTVGKPNDC